VQQLFAALETGYPFGATMHADTLDEVVAILAGYPLYVPLPAIARIDLVMTLAVDYVDRRPRRRLERLTLLRRGGAGDFPDLFDLARWDGARGAVVGFTGSPPPALLGRVGLDEEAFAVEWARRTAFLAALTVQERRDRADVRRQIDAIKDCSEIAP
jgi:hypothetical protein